MKVSVAQIKCIPGDLDFNLEQVAKFAKDAKSSGSDLVVFPEMLDTGYDTTRIKNLASSWSDKPYNFIRETAQEECISIVCGLSEKADADLYNSVVVFNDQGEEVAFYRKTHLITTEPICEQKTFTAGNSFTLVEINSIKFGVMVCYDIRFPEIARHLALLGASAIVVPSAWPMSRIPHWKTLLTARAIENQVYMICSNRVGIDGVFEFGGSSCIIDPWGELENFASTTEETLINQEIDLQRLEEVRNFMPVFKHRRKDLYSL